MKIIRYTNSTFEEEKALYVNGEVVLQGDCYHDEIMGQISGFFGCLKYLNIPFIVEDEYLTPEDELFDHIGFINDKFEDIDEDEGNYENE